MAARKPRPEPVNATETRLQQMEAELQALRAELHAAHEKKRVGDDIFRRFSESGIIGIALFDLSGKLLFANEALQQMLGCQAEELAAGEVSWEQFWLPEWHHRTQTAFEEMREHGGCVPFEAEYCRRDGTRFWAQFTGIMGDDHNAAAFVLDITARMEVEQERLRSIAREQEARARAEDAQRRLRVLAEATGALIGSLHLPRVLDAILELAGRLVPAGAYALWRLDRTTHCWGIAASVGLSAEYQSSVTAALEHSRGMPDTPLVVPDVDEEPLLAPHRHLLHGEGIRSMLVSPLLMPDEACGTLVFYFRHPHQFDETELMVSRALANLAASAIATTELYEAADQRAQQLVEADRLKDQFLAMLAHELRNPLGAISNATLVLQRAPSGTPAFQRAGEVVERQCRHMARLVDQLLDVSRLSHGKIELQTERIDLRRLIGDTCEDHRRILEAVGVSHTVELPEEPSWVEGDPTRLRQALGNLLQNAAKFTPSGGYVAVRAAVDTKNSRMKVSVTDTGIGIPPELLPRLFDPFVQADRSLDRTQGGLGLGLALVKGIIELHGGRVQAHSAGIGRGATFSFELPLQPPPGEGEPAAVPVRARSDGLRVLIIEDNVDGAETLRDLLELFGHEVQVAYSGTSGLEQARRLPPDVVLCDLGLPGMDGYAVAAALRQDPMTTTTRLIAVSGYGQAEDLRRATDAGFDAHLTKPVEVEALRRVLQ